MQDALDHPIEVLEHIRIGEPQGPDPMVLQETSSPLIVLSAVLGEVGIPIHFDGEPMLRVEEVETIRSDAVLSAELHPRKLPASEPHPEEHLGGWHLLAEMLPERLLGGSVEDVCHGEWPS
ncbi:MAG: hypothetical protein U0790_09740 [Isosphaeraceae bacterium]